MGSNRSPMMKTLSHLPDAIRLKTGVAALALALLLPAASPSWALSELQREDVPIPEEAEGVGDDDDVIREQLPPPEGAEQAPPRAAPDAGGEDQGEAAPDAAPQPEGESEAPAARQRQIGPVPFPDPIVIPQDTRKQVAEPETPEVDDDVPVPEVQYDVSKLPEPVRRLREKIMEACLTGDIEQLRPLLQTGPDGTQLSFNPEQVDPIEFLKSVSGDGEGQEILAILYEVLDSGYVIEEIENDQMYIWPYFYSVPLDTLTPRQRVELFKLVTAGDYQDMTSFGGYIFYRVGITPDGRWQFFVAGD